MSTGSGASPRPIIPEQALKTRIGPDLQAILESLEDPVLEIVELTTRRSPKQERGSFRIRCRSGALHKGVRLDDSDQARLVADLLAWINHASFPRPSLRSGKSYLTPWAQGQVLSVARFPPEIVESCGELLGWLHAKPLPEWAEKTSPPDWREKTRGRLLDLVRADFLSLQEHRDLTRIVRVCDPGHGPARITHRDFCPENLVLAEPASLHSIDNETLNLDRPEYDLARAWHRWPMDADRWRAFTRGYSRRHSPASFLQQHLFWKTAAVTSSVWNRIRTERTGWRASLHKLRRIHRCDRRNLV